MSFVLRVHPSRSPGDLESSATSAVPDYSVSSMVPEYRPDYYSASSAAPDYSVVTDYLTPRSATVSKGRADRREEGRSGQPLHLLPGLPLLVLGVQGQEGHGHDHDA